MKTVILAGGQKVVVAGTCAEYGWSHGVCLEDTTPLEPATLYGTAKDAARRLAMAVCAQHGVPCAWGRIFLPFGPGEAPQRLIPSLIEVFGGKRAPFGVNADACRDFLHASDVAEAFVALLRADKGAGEGAVNIASGEPVRLADLVVMLADLMGGRCQDRARSAGRAARRAAAADRRHDEAEGAWLGTENDPAHRAARNDRRGALRGGQLLDVATGFIGLDLRFESGRVCPPKVAPYFCWFDDLMFS